MKTSKVILFLILALLIAGVPSAFAFGRKPKPSPLPADSVHPKFACPMFCAVADKPGKCPKCGMEMGEVEFS